MRVYWRMSSIPELSGLSKKQRTEVLNATRWKHLRHWQFWISGAVFVCVLLLIPLLKPLLPEWPMRVAAGGLLGGIGGILIAQMAVHVKRPYWRALLESSSSSREP